MSVSSSEGISLPNDISAKYHILAAEYAKVRAQVNVLKKAVFDEQSRTSELKDEIKIKDQTLRKNSQELDSLMFRNQQLTKRVTVLQQELDIIQLSGKKNKAKQEPNADIENNTVIREELQKKIVENATLVTELEENQRLYKLEQQQMQKIVAALENSLKESQKPCKSCTCNGISNCFKNEEIDQREEGRSTIYEPNMNPCDKCACIRLKYDEKVSALEAKIVSMTEKYSALNMTELNSLQSGSECSKYLHEKFGKASVVIESAWHDSSLRELLLSKINLAIRDRQAAESKLTCLMVERNASTCRLEAAVEQVNHLSQSASRLQEELTTTTRNYEDQLSSMSEHMANMNDRLTAQQTHIEELSFQLQLKDQKRGWVR